MIYYRRYIEKFQLDTQDLTNTEVGVYDRLLDYYFGKERPIPFDRADSIARAVKTIDRQALQSVLSQFFTRGTDGWHNKRADHEIAMAKIARANGAKNGPDTGPDAGPEHPPDEGPDAGPDTTPEQAPAKAPGNGAHPPTGSGHPVKPLNLLASQPLQPPQPLNLSPNPVARVLRTPPQTGPTWTAYSLAYTERYGTPPVRNARVNGQLAQFVKRIGIEESPKVAAFYLTHNRVQYVRSQHAVGLLLQDAEGLHTEWATARKTSDTEARQADRTMATGNAFASLLEEAEHVEAIAK
ncbi:MAG TPA: DUF1376 domain-containing protein [Usitatibacter sp.]|nr:DUF1376 domain-containing protein [Usitatibacter sp.]